MATSGLIISLLLLLCILYPSSLLRPIMPSSKRRRIVCIRRFPLRCRKTISTSFSDSLFKEGEVACCGGGLYRGDYSCGGKRGIEEYELCENVNDFVFFETIHPTEAAAQHFANLMWTGNGSFTHPYNLKHLFEF